MFMSQGEKKEAFFGLFSKGGKKPRLLPSVTSLRGLTGRLATQIIIIIYNSLKIFIKSTFSQPYVWKRATGGAGGSATSGGRELDGSQQLSACRCPSLADLHFLLPLLFMRLRQRGVEDAAWQSVHAPSHAHTRSSLQHIISSHGWGGGCRIIPASCDSHPAASSHPSVFFF